MEFGGKAIIVGLIIFAIIVAVCVRASGNNVSSVTPMRLQRCTAVASGPANTIFIIIPNHQDSECIPTIKDAFLKASCPYRVFVGVCDVMGTGALLSQLRMSLGQNEDFIAHNTRVHTAHGSGNGPSSAKALAFQHLYRNEMYVMTVDAHTIFAEDWDAKSINQLQRANSERPILTMQPLPWPSDIRAAVPLSLTDRPGNFLCVGAIKESSGLPLIGSRSMAKHPARSVRQMFYSPCFSFTYATAYKDVPFDAAARFLFYGEEIAMSARLWTSGWDFFVPFTCLVLHRETGSPVPRVDVSKQLMDEKRVQVLLHIRDTKGLPPGITSGVEAPGDAFGLGTVRTIREYERFTGIDFPNCKVSQKAILGVTSMEDSVEILCKYGSNESYAHAVATNPSQIKHHSMLSNNKRHTRRNDRKHVHVPPNTPQ